MPEPQPKTVTVVGGGLAGIAAACALADSGYRVHLLERRPYLGGRASSYEHPGTGEVIDNCQHVLIGRCTSLIDLYRRLGVLDSIRWYDRFTFLTPGGQPSIIQPGPLPAPFHSTLAFLRAPAFSIRDKLAIARGLAAFMPGLPPDYCRKLPPLAPSPRPDPMRHRSLLETRPRLRPQRRPRPHLRPLRRQSLSRILPALAPVRPHGHPRYPLE